MPTYSHRFILPGTTEEQWITVSAGRPCHARDHARNLLTVVLNGTPYMGAPWVLMEQGLSS